MSILTYTCDWCSKFYRFSDMAPVIADAQVVCYDCFEKQFSGDGNDN